MAPGWPLFPHSPGNEESPSSDIALPRLEPEERIWLQQSTAGEESASSAAAPPVDKSLIAAEPVDESLIAETFRIASDIADEKQAREKPFHELYQAQVREVESYLKKIADISHGLLTFMSYEVYDKNDRHCARRHMVSISKPSSASLEIRLIHPLELQKSEHSKFHRPMEIDGKGDGYERERYANHYSFDAVKSETANFLGRILSPEQIRALQSGMAQSASPPSPK